MLLFVTTRRFSLEYERRSRQFENLGIPFRPFPLSDQAFPEIVGSLRRKHLGARLWAILRGIFRLRAEIKGLSAGDVLYVNALDSLVPAILARTGLKTRPRLICQILDVHYLLLYPNPYRAILRRIERWALGQIDLLIVPSPGAIPRYFRPIARYRGPVAVVNNTVPSGETRKPEPPPVYAGAWVIGWFGSLRCERGLEILCRTAAALGPRAAIRIAGASKLPPGFLEKAIAPYPNITYLGPFKAPQDLAALYRAVHFSYAVHFESPTKSQWALPVRMLEGGAHGRPALVRADTDVGAYLRENGIGWGIAEPCETALPRFLETLSPAEYLQTVERVRVNRHYFIGDEQLSRALAQLDAP